MGEGGGGREREFDPKVVKKQKLQLWPRCNKYPAAAYRVNAVGTQPYRTVNTIDVRGVCKCVRTELVFCPGLATAAVADDAVLVVCCCCC